MTNVQKAKVELSKIRERLGALSGKEDRTEEETKEMRQLMDEGYPNAEAALRAAEISEGKEEEEVREDEVDAEARELARLEDRADLGRYLEAAVQDRAVDGAEAELNAALEISGSGHFPLRLIAPDEEHRDDAATSLSIDTAVRPVRWLDRLFKGSVTADLGITPTPVPAGVAAYPVTTGGTAAKSVGKGTAVDANAFVASVEELKPTRMAAAYLFEQADVHRIPMLEDKMRADLRLALADGMANEIINGSADGTSIDGILDGVTPLQIDGTADAAISSVTTPSSFIGGVVGLVDGIHALDLSDIRALLSPEAYAFFMNNYDSTGNALRGPVLGNLRSAVYGIQSRATDHLGEIPGNGNSGEHYCIFSLQRGLMGAVAMPVWEQGQIIVDPYSKAAEGRVRLTLNAYWNLKVLRASNFAVRRVALT